MPEDNCPAIVVQNIFLKNPKENKIIPGMKLSGKLLSGVAENSFLSLWYLVNMIIDVMSWNLITELVNVLQYR